MANPALRRFIRLDDGELDHVAGMSAEKQKEWTQVQIMRVCANSSILDGFAG